MKKIKKICSNAWIVRDSKEVEKLIQYKQTAGTLNLDTIKSYDKAEDKNPKWKGLTVHLAFNWTLWADPEMKDKLCAFAFYIYSCGGIVKFVTWKD